MDAVDSRRIEAGDGTPELHWQHWLQARALPRVAPQELLPPGARAVVVAPHPDDEVLAVGGLLAHAAALGRRALLVAVTDGEASHTGSTRWPPGRLAARRRAETRLALARLGSGAAVLRAGLADGRVAAQADALHALLLRTLQPSDRVFTTWTLDGHPDHEATGRTTRAAAAQVGARVYEVPVWGWHWAQCGDARMPWAQAHLVTLSPQAVARKSAALQTFASQWEHDPGCAHTPILRASMQVRARRPFELVFA
ncbi:PIG-L family deacetylase [Pseudorhodoferax sp. LjRoot39]|uniref:PIG-L deacetylase family protein n=1 Tax=Pseudorhodoferax sp. LjRoot39 TaxID=3342328 RepID=UPI003ECD9A56